MTRKALSIGINGYPGTGSDLAGCVNDARDWAGELTGRGFAVTQVFRAQVMKTAIRAAFQALIGGARDGDTLVITYSGHGTWVPDSSGDGPDGRDEGLGPYDIGTSEPLLDDEIRGLFASRAAGVRILLLSDSCHSARTSWYGSPWPTASPTGPGPPTCCMSAAPRARPAGARRQGMHWGPDTAGGSTPGSTGTWPRARSPMRSIWSACSRRVRSWTHCASSPPPTGPSPPPSGSFLDWKGLGPNSGWVHLALRPPGQGDNRRQLLSCILDTRTQRWV